MKTVTEYVCEYCGQSYSQAEKCISCESSHIPKEDLTIHEAYYQAKKAFPVYVWLKCGEQKARYKRYE